VVAVIETVVERPIDAIVADWNLLDDSMVAKFTMFRTMGQNIFGIRRHAITRTQIVDMTKHMTTALLELGPGGIVVPRFEPMRMHITCGGTPHRVPHSMGYWHINDMDELYLPLPSAPGDALGHNIIVMQNPAGGEGESWAWYCERCLTLLFERRHDTGALGMDFKVGELAVREYNSNPRHRTCPDCGHVNPLGYNWNPGKDTEEERAARAIW
jgi:hypothetical protein